MGLFTRKKQLNIFEIIGFELLKEHESQMIVDIAEPDFTDYKILFKDNLGIFDTVIFRIFGGKKNLSGSSVYNLIFSSSNQISSPNKLETLIKSILRNYGQDKNGNDSWTLEDTNRASRGFYHRTWYFGKNNKSYSDLHIDSEIYQLGITLFEDEGISLIIHTANELLNFPD